MLISFVVLIMFRRMLAPGNPFLETDTNLQHRCLFENTGNLFQNLTRVFSQFFNFLFAASSVLILKLAATHSMGSRPPSGTPRNV